MCRQSRLMAQPRRHGFNTQRESLSLAPRELGYCFWVFSVRVGEAKAGPTGVFLPCQF